MRNYKQHPETWVIHWPTFGPYHVARLTGAVKILAGSGIKIVGLEIAPVESNYGWSKINHSELYEHQLVFDNSIYEDISSRRMWSGIYSKLNILQPDGLFINGYSSVDAQAILMWARTHHKPAILMSESKEDDAPRSAIMESCKRFLVHQFSAAICGGAPHRSYLEKLGMRREKIYTGYDAVDNDYFYNRVINVRSNPDKYRCLPGLDSEMPFFLASSRFITRKNIEGLLRAYQQYKMICASNGEQRPWRLIVLGDGEQRTELVGLICNQQIDGVTLAGFQQIENLPAYYGLANLFIHIPLQEQWGLVVNEAMASGLPVLVSSCCGCADDLIKQGVNGYVVDPNDLDEISTVMYSMAHGDVNLESYGLASLEIIGFWGPDRFGEAVRLAIQATFVK